MMLKILAFPKVSFTPSKTIIQIFSQKVSPSVRFTCQHRLESHQRIELRLKSKSLPLAFVLCSQKKDTWMREKDWGMEGGGREREEGGEKAGNRNGALDISL